jgi:hypothetical protein
MGTKLTNKTSIVKLPRYILSSQWKCLRIMSCWTDFERSLINQNK